MIVEIFDGKVYHIYPEYTKDSLPEVQEIVFRDLPKGVVEGTAYDLESDSLVVDDFIIKYREMEINNLLRRCDADSGKARRKIRAEDKSYSWQALLDALDKYAEELESVRNQKDFPLIVQYPAYPSYVN